MSELTILESESFWDELIKRSANAQDVLECVGKARAKSLLIAAFALKQEYDEKMKEGA